MLTIITPVIVSPVYPFTMALSHDSGNQPENLLVECFFSSKTYFYHNVFWKWRFLHLLNKEVLFSSYLERTPPSLLQVLLLPCSSYLFEHISQFCYRHTSDLMSQIGVCMTKFFYLTDVTSIKVDEYCRSYSNVFVAVCIVYCCKNT